MRDLKSDELTHVYGAGGRGGPQDDGKKRFGHTSRHTSRKHRTSQHKKASRHFKKPK